METTQELRLNHLLGFIFIKRRFILFYTLAIVLLCGLLRLIIPEKYEAEAVFMVKNPMYKDKNNLYSYDNKLVDYFANEDEMDKLISMAESDSVQLKIISSMKLDSLYRYNMNDAKEMYKLRKRFNKRLKIYRTENKNVVLAFSDPDPVRAAHVVDVYINMVAKATDALYMNMRQENKALLTGKIKEEDSTLKLLTDSLVNLRETYKIYDIVNPRRSNIIVGNVNWKGGKDFARGLELIQNVEAIKDELVSEKARHITLAAQYDVSDVSKTGTILQVVKNAKVTYKPQEPSMPTTLLCAFALGLFSGIVLVLRSYKEEA